MARLASLVLALLVSACALLPAGNAQEPVVTYPAGERPPAPQIRAASLNGGEDLDLAQFDGPVVLNFWASWCGPCKTEAPHLNAVAENYADDGVAVVGVNSKDDLVNAQAFAAGNLRFPSFFDPEQAIAAQFGASGPVGLPSTLLLDHEHRVAVRFFGAISGALLAPYLQQVIEEGGTEGGR